MGNSVGISDWNKYVFYYNICIVCIFEVIRSLVMVLKLEDIILRNNFELFLFHVMTVCRDNNFSLISNFISFLKVVLWKNK